MLGSFLEPLTYTIHLWVDWSLSSRLSGGIYLGGRERDQREQQLKTAKSKSNKLKTNLIRAQLYISAQQRYSILLVHTWTRFLLQLSSLHRVWRPQVQMCDM